MTGTLFTNPAANAITPAAVEQSLNTLTGCKCGNIPADLNARLAAVLPAEMMHWVSCHPVHHTTFEVMYGEGRNAVSLFDIVVSRKKNHVFKAVNAYEYKSFIVNFRGCNTLGEILKIYQDGLIAKENQALSYIQMVKDAMNSLGVGFEEFRQLCCYVSHNDKEVAARLGNK